MKALNYIIEKMKNEKGYTALFKASVMFFTFYLVSLIQVSEFLQPIESEAKENKYMVEYELKKEFNFKELNCSFEMKTYTLCKMALYNNNLVVESLTALKNIRNMSLLLGVITLVLSVIGFLSCPYEEKK